MLPEYPPTKFEATDILTEDQSSRILHNQADRTNHQSAEVGNDFHHHLVGHSVVYTQSQATVLLDKEDWSTPGATGS